MYSTYLTYLTYPLLNFLENSRRPIEHRHPALVHVAVRVLIDRRVDWDPPPERDLGCEAP